MREAVAVLLFWETTCKCRKNCMPRAVRKTTQEIEKSSKACQPADKSNVLCPGFVTHRRYMGSHELPAMPQSHHLAELQA